MLEENNNGGVLVQMIAVKQQENKRKWRKDVEGGKRKEESINQLCNLSCFKVERRQEETNMETGKAGNRKPIGSF